MKSAPKGLVSLFFCDEKNQSISFIINSYPNINQNWKLSIKLSPPID